jgi:hypothetical protein
LWCFAGKTGLQSDQVPVSRGRYSESMYRQVSNAGAEYQHWNLRGDLVATSGPSSVFAATPLTDAFGDTVNGSRQT